jgi:hypothetical protein
MGVVVTGKTGASSFERTGVVDEIDRRSRESQRETGVIQRRKKE